MALSPGASPKRRTLPLANLEARDARRTCCVCNIEGPLAEEAFPICDACEARRYCSRACQIVDWTTGGHEDVCTFSYDSDATAEVPHAVPEAD